MGTAKETPFWVLVWMAVCIGLTTSDTGSAQVNVIPTMTKIQMLAGTSPVHNEQVCSTWGNYHFKTFDGDIFQLPSSCNYVLASQCKSSYEDFNIQMRRELENGLPIISKITMVLEGTVVELVKGSVSVNGKLVILPFSESGVLIEKSSSYINIKAKLGLLANWNEDDAFMVELDKKYVNQTCGLCGDFNGVQTHNEFVTKGVPISNLDYGSLWKLDGPTETCTEPITPEPTCKDMTSVCEQLLSNHAFESCKAVVNADSFIKACARDLCLCANSSDSFCLCGTISEYSRQCIHAGGKPGEWRTEQFCSKSCPSNMVHQECGSPCVDTCSNPDRGQVCEEHCMDGCFCPPGTVFDDVTGKGCISSTKCSCSNNGNIYQPGESYSSNCKHCTCGGGQWSCIEKDCPATCSVEGGSHFFTYDGKAYTFHGDCTYVLTKQCNGADFTVLGDLVRCGLTDTETCLKAVTLAITSNSVVINIQPNGKVFVNRMYSQLPLSTAGVTIFEASTFFIIVQTSVGIQLEIQLSPIMQVYITADSKHKQKTCGLCGNFNNIQADDFLAMNGITEGTASGFANTWKTRASCPDVKSSLENPCSLSIDNEKYAQQWCSLLTDPDGVFSPCHSEINPDIYKSNCMYDSCNCEKSEDCMCAALSSYVHACAAKGIQLNGWRDTTCKKYANNCPSNMAYAYSIQNSDRTCRCYSDPDFTCSATFAPVDGCICEKGTYLDEGGTCVAPANCSCYYKGQVIPPGEVISKDKATCTCKAGKLSCMGETTHLTPCPAPMVHFNCSNADAGAKGAECQRSCKTLHMACISAECVSGCVCPSGLVSDGKGGCVKEDQCPCYHNGAQYKAGDSIKVDCNECTCKDTTWDCTSNLCHGTCAIYGDGHYITFDGKRFNFDGSCEYILTENYCGHGSTNGTFRVITENIPCGTTGATCSKAIKLFLGSNELILTDGGYQVVKRNSGAEVPYQIRTMGIYLVIEANNGLILMWDRRTSLFLKLSPDFKSHVCGLCGNYDGNANNDFGTRNQGQAIQSLEFGNSWKVSPSCPDAKRIQSPCTSNPYRKSWAQKKCSIIISEAFASCHFQVDPSPFYDACVSDSCACDSGGDCECFCTAVAAYAAACNEAGACVAWRTPKICPLFCDYYNPPGECEWHYKPCGAPCMKTCRNPTGQCSQQIPALEGCYPQCPADEPFFDEDTMKCVQREKCGCFDSNGRHYSNGEKVPSTANCETCQCISTTISCKFDAADYEIKVECCKMEPCPTTTNTPAPMPTPTTTSTTTTTTTPLTTPPLTTPSTPIPRCTCEWSDWIDLGPPTPGTDGGDSVSISQLINSRRIGLLWAMSNNNNNNNTVNFNNYSHDHNDIYYIYQHQVECRAKMYPTLPLSQLGQDVTCNPSVGVVCLNKNQGINQECFDYEIRVRCCGPCTTTTTTTPTSTSTPSTPTTPTSTTTSTTTTTTETPSTTVPTTPSTSTTTPTTTTTSTTSTSTVTSTTPSTPIPICTCEWSDWIDLGPPSSGPDGGDSESISQLINSKRIGCPQPTEVECRAKMYPTLPLSQLGQDVTCNPSVGVVCLNKNQGINQECFDYEIRVRCCGPCTTTTTTTPTSTSTPSTPTTPTSTTTSTTTTTTETPSTTVPTTPSTSTTTPTTTTTSTTSTSTVTSTTPSTPIPICTCEWSDWIDLGPPSSGPDGGDSESISQLINSKRIGCPQPTEVECRAKMYPTLPLSQLGQDVTCNPSVGVVCLNKNQGNNQECFDYEIRVRCCGPCTTTTTTTPTSTSTPSTPTTPTSTTTSTTTTTTETPSTTVPTTPSTSTTTPTTTTTSTTSTSTVTSTTPSTPIPICTCEWSDWIDLGPPSSGPDGGDSESISQLINSKRIGCPQPTEVECRAKMYPTLPLSQLGQDVTCNPSVGVVCLNKNQGINQECFDYEIRVRCCGPCTTTTTTTPTSTSTPSTPTTPTSTTTSTTTTTTETPSTTVPTTPSTSTTTPTTTTTSTTSTSTVTSTTPSTPIPICTCEWSDWIDLGPPSSGPDGGDSESISQLINSKRIGCPQPTEVECRAKMYPTLPLSQLGQDVTCNPSVGVVCLNKNQGINQECFDYEIRVRCCGPCTTTTTTTPTSTSTPSTPTTPTSTTTSTTTTTTETPSTTVPTTPSTSTTTPTTTTTSTTSTSTVTSTTPSTPIPICTCEWSDWIDLGPPSSGPDGGDSESISQLINSKRIGCPQPTEVECRAKMYPTLPLSQLGQDVTCNPSVGVVCLNKNQGINQECFDYEIRVRCCGPCTTTTTTTPTSTSTPSTPTTPTSTTTSTTTTTTETPSTTVPTTPSTSTTTPTTTTTSTTSTSTVTSTTPSTPIPICTCEWSDWIDLGPPSSGPDGGDSESISQLINSKRIDCPQPTEVECRAKMYPTLPLSQLGQDVTCNPSVGVVCLNKNQGNNQECFDYEIRVRCCGPCTTTTTTTPTSTSTPSTPTTPTSTTTSTTTTTTETPSTTVPTTPSTSTTTPTTTTTSTTSTSTVTSTTPSTPIPICTCEWSDWIDLGPPSSGPDGGDSESISQLINSKRIGCPQPTEVECRAKMYPTLPLSQLGQDVTCNPSVGVVCLNKNQGINQVCFDYEIRVRCCGPCTTTTTTTPTSTSTPSTPTTPTSTTTSTTTTTTETPSTTVPTTPATSTTTPTTTTTSTTSTSTVTSTTPSTPIPICTCEWSDWIDLGPPSSGPDGGDSESISQLINSKRIGCPQPTEVECRAKMYPTLPLSQLGQDVTCNPSVGVVCLNKNQGNNQECFDYEIRVRCCGPCTTTTTTTPTSTSTPSTPTTPTSTTTSTTTTTTETPSTTVPTTPATSTTTPTTTTTSTTSTSTVTSTTPSTPIPICTCEWSDWIDLGPPSSGPDGGDSESISQLINSKRIGCPQPTEVECRAKMYPTLPLSQLGQDVTCNPSVGVVCLNKNQGNNQECFDYEIRVRCCGPCTTTTTTTPTSTSTPSTPTTPTSTTTSTTTTTTETPSTTVPTTPSTSTTTPTTTTTSTTSTSTVTSTTPSTPIPICTCEWSDWIDLGPPSSGPDGGDSESISQLINSKRIGCPQPTEVECRAKMYPTLPLSQLGQDVTCNPSVGVVCLNKNQGNNQECFDYEIRVRCCGPCTTTTTTTPTSTSTPSTPTTPTSTTTSTTTTTTETPSTTVPTTPSTSTTTPTTTATSTTSTSTVTSTTPSTPIPICTCEWSDWIDLGPPSSGPDGGDSESISQLINSKRIGCPQPTEVECRAKMYPTLPLSQLGQDVTCNPSVGVVCLNKNQGNNQECFDYEIRVRCCGPCTTTTTTTPTSTSTPSTPTTPTSTTTSTTTTTTETPSTTVPTTPSTSTTTPTTTATSTTSTSTVTSTTPSTPIPICTCEWSDWIDLGPPSSGPDGGDSESISQLINSKRIGCPQPTEVECRAKMYPTLPLSQLGQDVTCNPSVGVVCLNKNQGNNQECFDYEIRVRCCGPCTTTTTTTPTSTSTPSTPTTPISTTNSTTTTTTETPSTTVPMTPSTSTTISTTTAPTTTMTSTTSTSTVTSTTPSTPIPHCTCEWSDWIDLGPPTPGPDGGESSPVLWTMSTNFNNDHNHNTFNHNNDYNNSIKFNRYNCHCFGFGDPHYVTFDGTYYNFQGNCSYILVKEIKPIYNFSIIIDNVYCDAPDGLSCPKSLTIYYKSFEIYMSQDFSPGNVTNLIYVNHKRIYPAYRNSDFEVTNTGIDAFVTIPAIGAQIMFSGLQFSVELPWSIFHGNTEGQCGTCDNNRTDDCLLPNGKIDPSCPDMAHQWKINDSNCPVPPTPIPPTACPPETSAICKIIASKVFEMCHEVIPYDVFIEGCEFDICYTRNISIGCASLQSYAQQCALNGICIDWRGATAGVCDFECNAPLVYQACGPQVPSTCDRREIQLGSMAVIFAHVMQTMKESTAILYHAHLSPLSSVISLARLNDKLENDGGLHRILCAPIICDTYCPQVNGIWSPPGNKCVKYECVKVGSTFITMEARTLCPPYNPNDCIPVSVERLNVNRQFDHV
ncbi:mucin-5AC-like [Alosa pseudoharengus]|uniref:mucin-5AC-like n=1 Tax=Alosa pseudoharengus TaxID=34774 RepID=UPI003F8B3026